MTATAKAGEAMGRSISGAASDLGDAVAEVQDFGDRGHLADIRLRMMEAEKEHALFRQENIDESAWAGDWEERVKEVETFARSRQMLPKNGIRAEQTVEEWKIVSSLGVRDAMLGQSLDRSRQSVANALATAEREGRWDDAYALLGDLEGIDHPETIEALREKIEASQMKHAKRMNRERYMQFAPEDYEETLKNIGNDERFLPYEREKMRQDAERVQEAHELESLRGIAERIDTGDIRLGTELDAAIPEWVDEATRERLMRNFEATEAPLDPDEHTRLQDLIDDLNAAYVASNGEIDEETYNDMRNKVELELLPFKSRKSAQQYWASFGRTTVANQRARLENLRSGKSDVPEWMENKIDLGTAYLQDIMGADPDRFEGMSAQIKEEWKQALPSLIMEFPDESFDKIFPRFQVRRLRGELLPDKQASSESGSLLDFVKGVEGYTPTAKWDVRQWSVGYGTRGKRGEVVGKTEAARRLGQELAMHRDRVVKEAAKHGYQFKDHELDALTSFDFNSGKIGWLLEGKPSPKEIADRMMRWTSKDPKLKRGVTNRRAKERNLFLYGY